MRATAAIYRLLLRASVTKGRLAGLGALGALAVVIGVAIGANDVADPLDDGAVMVTNFGLSLFVPVTTLVLASAVLGDPDEDGTLVYLWLRPVARWRIAVAALGAALTGALPLVVLPMAVAAGATGAGAGLVAGTLAACALGTIAYGAMFTWLGLRVRRALVWGLAYVLVWEGFVARAGETAGLFAVRSYTRTLLARISDGPERMVDVSAAAAVVVPLAVTAAAVGLTVRRLRRQDVA